MITGRFKEMFRDAPGIYVPDMVDGLYTDWVLVQEMTIGERIIAGGVPRRPVRARSRAVEAYVRQLFAAGVFPGEAHPGSLFVLPDRRRCLHGVGLIRSWNAPRA